MTEDWNFSAKYRTKLMINATEDNSSAHYCKATEPKPGRFSWCQKFSLTTNI